MTNKKLGASFEKLACEHLKKLKYWVHVITPDSRGAQPFDIVAVRNGKAAAIECKTLSDRLDSFPLSRLEQNQHFAFDYWLECGNNMPEVWVLWRGKVYSIPWSILKAERRIKMQYLTPIWEVENDN